MTLYPDAIIATLAPVARRPRVFLPFGTTPAQAQSLRAQHYATIPGLSETDNDAAEAARLGCDHIFAHGVLTKLSGTEA
jgi:ATP phosphoribosyltransferase regulatory subunit